MTGRHIASAYIRNAPEMCTPEMDKAYPQSPRKTPRSFWAGSFTYDPRNDGIHIYLLRKFSNFPCGEWTLRPMCAILTIFVCSSLQNSSKTGRMIHIFTREICRLSLQGMDFRKSRCYNFPPKAVQAEQRHRQIRLGLGDRASDTK